MKVAIIGGGISGMMVADQLNGSVDYTLFEQADYLGGHANTQSIVVEGKNILVDTGFIVFNRDIYHHFNGMLERYGVKTIKSDMSFAVSNRSSGLEYNATNLRSLFCQKLNLFNPKFYRMIFDIKKFYAQAEEILRSGTQAGIYEYFKANNYSDIFIDEHIIPMVSALWSGDFNTVKDYPLVFMLQFMKNHQMLQINNRPEWRTIKNGSQTYVQAIIDQMTGELQLNNPVEQVTREGNQVAIHTANGIQYFDRVVFATHTDVTMDILQDMNTDEIQALGGIPYVENHMDLHTDNSLLPKNKNAWASWSVNKHVKNQPVCTVNYYMNILQSLDCETTIIVSLNQNEYIDKNKILVSKKYQHPVYTQQTLEAQKNIQLLQGKRNTFHCGAYLGWGFHEDGARSGVQVAERIKKQL